MKVCQHCNLSFADDANFCPKCNAQLLYVNIQPQPMADPLDHTAQFDTKDISDNKVFAMLPYLASWIGIVIALLAAGSSPFTAFHVRQALKIQISATLAIFAAIVPFIGWIFVGVVGVIALVVNIICFFRVCAGKAKEAPIVSSFGFLK